MAIRKPYPSDVSDEEWAFVAPYLTLVREDAPQRNHDLREVFNGLRWIVRTGSAWRYMPHDLPPWEAVYQQPQADAARVALKAGKMAVQAHLKVVGVVENMGYAECPDCGKELRIFGGEGGDRVAGELGSQVMGRIPIQPEATGEPGRSLFEVDSTPARAFDDIAAALAATRVRRRVKVL